MFQKLIDFVKYHNAFPIALSVILLSSGAAFAASPEARSLIVSEETTVRSVDNSYIVSVDLDARNPQLQITAIQEDDVSYYVSYSYNTITIDDYMWKGFNTTKTLTVSKEALGDRDLGLYVAEEISEVVSREDEFLKEVQGIEKRKGATKKIATTEYSGLVGKMLRSKEEEFDGYVPRIPEKKAVVATVSGAQTSTQPVNNSGASTQASVPTKDEIRLLVQETVKELLAETSSSTTPATSGDTDITAPVITVVGNNPAEIAKNASYVDLGATVTDNVNNNLGIAYAVDGVVVSSINLDTSTDVTYTITYSATDQAGNTGTATRTVVVGTGETSTEPETTTATTTPEAVTDTTAPVISLVGDASKSIEKDASYVDAGATAQDDTDGDITSDIVTVNGVDITTVGTYVVTYTVRDDAGNSATEVVRTVTVTAPITPEDTATSTPTSQE
ncbi:MAG: immunoglobulin-like domain-containing protein [Candidatus Paceibacterota bacterium]